MRAIIFGVGGQDGYYLSQLLEKQGIEIIGVSRNVTETKWIRGDVKDRLFVEQLIHTYQPQYIFHLAANSTTAHHALFENHETISTGTLNILEAVYTGSKHSKVFLSGSAVQFENRGLPINEQTPFAPLNAYAVSRIHSVYAGRYYRNLGIQVYVGYFFNHDSPLRTERHINQKIAAVVKRISKGSNEKIEIGNIDVKKEFNYAGDVVRAIWQIVNQDKIHEVIIGNGEAYSIFQWVEYCFKKMNLDWRNFTIIKKDYSPEYQILVSDPTILKSMGWRPLINFYQLADIMLADKL